MDQSSESLEATIEAVTNTPTGGLSFPDFSAIPFFLLLVGSYFLALWLALVHWVWNDSLLRIEDESRRRLFMALVILFNFPGVVIYFLLRPASTFTELERQKREEEIVELELTKLRREVGK